jgi:hypothetical protein
MSQWDIPEELFLPTLADQIMSATVRKAREEYDAKLRQAELDMGGPIEIVRTEWRDGKYVTWYRAAGTPCHVGTQ